MSKKRSKAKELNKAQILTNVCEFRFWEAVYDICDELGLPRESPTGFMGTKGALSTLDRNDPRQRFTYDAALQLNRIVEALGIYDGKRTKSNFGDRFFADVSGLAMRRFESGAKGSKGLKP